MVGIHQKEIKKFGLYCKLVYNCNTKSRFMESTTKQMNAEESLKLIQSMIDAARNKVADDGFHLILWGILVIICSLLNYFLFIGGFNQVCSIPWIIMPFVGVPVGYYYEKRIRKEGYAKTIIDKHVAYIWWSYGFTLFIGILYCVNIGISPIPFILLSTGLVTFASGLILQFRPMMAGGIIFWILAATCIFVNSINQLWLEALGVFLGYIIPGILLRRKAQQANV
jgi:hypothetical protein